MLSKPRGVQCISGHISCPSIFMPHTLPRSLRDAIHHPELIVGRTAAACVHPVAAWRVLPVSWRVLVLTVYTVSSYLAVLGALVALNP